MKAIQVNIPGGPENLQLVDVPVPQPGPSQALVRIAASGVNFIDIYFRTGLVQSRRADRHRQRGRRHGGSSRRGRDRSRARRPRGLRDGSRLLRGVRRGARGHAGENPRTRRFPHGCRRHAARHDGPLSHALHVSAQGRRHLPGACGGGRRRRTDRADGEEPRRARLRYGFHRREGQHRARSRRRRSHPLYRAGVRRGSAASHRRPRRRCGLRFRRQDHI